MIVFDEDDAFQVGAAVAFSLLDMAYAIRSNPSFSGSVPREWWCERCRLLDTPHVPECGWS